MAENPGLDSATVKQHDKITHRISRRSFLRKFVQSGVAVGTAAAGTGVLIGGPTSKNWIESSFNGNELTQEINEGLLFIKNRYSLDIDFKPNGNGEELMLAEKRDALRWLRQEIAHYPPEYFGNLTGLKRFRILSNAKNPEGILVGGLVQVPVRLNVDNGKVNTTAINIDELILSKRMGLLDDFNEFGWNNGSNFKAAFHHELFHFADICINEQKAQVDFEEWIDSYADRNDPYLGYIGNDFRKIHSRPVGFAKAYGKYTLVEDRATVGELLQTDSKKADELSVGDATLASKIQKIKAFYLRESKGKIDEQYWADLKQGKVNESYWDTKLSTKVTA